MIMSLFKHSLVRLLCLCMIVAAVTARPGAGKSTRVYTRNNQDQRLVGGEPVTGTEYNFLVSLRIMPKELHRCGGFLISTIHVMTTASCIYSSGTKELHAYVNPLRFDNLGTYIRVRDVKSHPNFTLTPHENDIAVLRLEKAYTTTAPIIPDWVDVPTKADVLTFGWGYDKVSGGVGNFTLHMYQLQVMGNGLCSLVLREYLGCDILCAASPNQFATSPSDVGTPLIYIGSDKKVYAVGMLVKETDDMVNAAPYMRLRQFLEWINQSTNGAITSTTLPPTSTTEEETSTTPLPTTEIPPEEAGTGAESGEQLFPDDYQEQPIKGRSRKRASFQRQMFRDASTKGQRQISHFG